MGPAVTFIKTSNFALCRQKEFVYSLNIVHKQRSLIDPFSPRLFSIAAPLRALSILTNFFDKCQMKSIEDINVLIKVKLFCWKNLLFWKKFLFERKFKKSCFFEKKTVLFESKEFFLEKNIGKFGKNFFLPPAPFSFH